ncbi:RND family efflux transporter, MFP subunit [Chishuiella changwenlii]|uniref:Hemolysin D n=1 Tax=Chishuiella changwenlii TaxID=1434701 RepID=A0A1M7ANA1_9FLAO|nr:hemolysin D [Chishuiella changwenlii]SHL43879.1 RND family efflux transporter, MFP subunit [Chishuiella changwenlii]
MKLSYQTFKINFYLSLILIVLVSCNNENQTMKEEKETHSESEHSKSNKEEESSTVTTLTNEQIKEVGISFGKIEDRDLTATIKANGTLRVPNNSKANATSLYGGVIKTLRVQLGDYVKKGQVIATIENPQFIQLQDEYLMIDSRIKLAEQESQRQRILNEGGAGALKNLQSATTDLSTLRTRKASLHKQIQLMGINPNNVKTSNMRTGLAVLSPISGTVSNEFAKIGTYVDVSSPVLEIVNNSLLHLDLQIFEKDLPFIKVGQMVNFTITNNPNTIYSAKVFNIGSSFEDESKTIAIHCTVIGNKTGLIDGMNITGTISIDNVLTPTVTDQAIVEADGKYYIFIIKDKAKNEFEKVEITKNASNLGYTAITTTKNIPKNIEIVTKGAFFINAKLENKGGHEH